MTTTLEGIELGIRPEPLKVILSKGGDFKATMRLNDVWPVGTVLSLILNGTTYNATIASTDATWVIDKAITDAIPDKAPAVLRYVNGTDDENWAVGQVVRVDA